MLDSESARLPARPEPCRMIVACSSLLSFRFPFPPPRSSLPTYPPRGWVGPTSAGHFFGLFPFPLRGVELLLERLDVVREALARGLQGLERGGFEVSVGRHMYVIDHDGKRGEFFYCGVFVCMCVGGWYIYIYI